MSGKIRKVIYVGLAGLAVWGVANIAGTDNALTTLNTGVTGSAWGLGALARTAPNAVPASVAGWRAMGSYNQAFPASGPSPQPSAQPKKAAKKKPPVKVPNCTAKQKKAAAAACA